MHGELSSVVRLDDDEINGSSENLPIEGGKSGEVQWGRIRSGASESWKSTGRALKERQKGGNGAELRSAGTAEMERIQYNCILFIKCDNSTTELHKIHKSRLTSRNSNTKRIEKHKWRWKNSNTCWSYVRKQIDGIPIWNKEIIVHDDQKCDDKRNGCMITLKQRRK